jgi:hypothetical protein
MRSNSPPLKLGFLSENDCRADNTPHSSHSKLNSDLVELENAPIKKTLTMRSEIPLSIYLVAMIIFASQLSGSIYTQNVMDSVLDSLSTSLNSAKSNIKFLKEFTEAVVKGQSKENKKILLSLTSLFIIILSLYVLFVAPLLAGMWTGRRARRHLMHRYMGLIYLFMYFAAWVEFLSDRQTTKDSYLPHFISLLGEVMSQLYIKLSYHLTLSSSCT